MPTVAETSTHLGMSLTRARALDKRPDRMTDRGAERPLELDWTALGYDSMTTKGTEPDPISDSRGNLQESESGRDQTVKREEYYGIERWDQTRVLRK